MLLKILFCAICFLLVIGTSDAITIYVPDNYSTIQDAIDAADGGDTIIVRPGEYKEKIDFLGKAIAVRSEQGAALTTINGCQSGSVVKFINGEGPDSVVEGFTISNGTGTGITNKMGGGILCTGSSPTILANIITGNTVSSVSIWEARGGGICCNSDSSPIISGNTVSGNSANAYGGLSGCGGGIFSRDNSSLLVSNNTITGNISSGSGGGIYCIDSSAQAITDNTISDNAANFGSGGGIYCESISSLTITGNTIARNSVSGHYCSGGGICCGAAQIFDNIITDNTATGSYSRGGGIDFGSATIANNIITGNKATNGGGVHSEGGGSYDFISGNTATGLNCPGWGGIYGRDTAQLTNNIITGNLAYEHGGGIYCYIFSDLKVTNNIISGNTAGDGGGGIYCYLYSSPVVTNNIITCNSAGYGGGFYCGGEDCDPAITNTIIWENSAQTGQEIYVGNLWGKPATLTIGYSDVEGGLSSVYVESGCTLNWDGPSMIDADPLFVDQADEDYHLIYESLCKDAGDNSAASLPPEDFEGDPRIAGGVVDMGADEFHTHLYHTGDVVPGGVIEIKTVGTPAMPVRLALGSGIQDPPQSTQYGDLYLLPPYAQFSLGSIPSNGVLVVPGTVPGSWQAGDVHPFQALVGPLGNPASELTNLHCLQVQ